MEETRDQATAGALADLKSLTLTVVDGDFPREVLARKNLRFGEYRMPARRNKPESYDAKLNAPGAKQEGTVYLGALSERAVDLESLAQAPPAADWRSSPWSVALTAMALLVAGLAVLGRKGWVRRIRSS